MALEDTIRYSLFSISVRDYGYNIDASDFVIECKAERGKPVPLCMPFDILDRTDLAYKRLYQPVGSGFRTVERATPRAMYNHLFSTYVSRESLTKVKVKESVYYWSSGVLFNEGKHPLFYFAADTLKDDDGHINRVIPRLYLTTELLADATTTGKPMERFFMSTIVPYLIDHMICARHGYSNEFTVIEVDNNIDDVFFIPESTLVTSSSVEDINDRLNDILADNADTIASFVENYNVSR